MLGDLLAGIFAPLAFIWLVVGYFMQAKALALTCVRAPRYQSFG